MSRKDFLFTSESVTEGHPDKIADQISDAILDACLAQDRFSKVACETMVTTGLVIVAGEITTSAFVDYEDVIRKMIQEIGYVDPSIGFDYRSCGVILSLNKQSADIAIGVQDNGDQEHGAGDQGLMFGFACDETAELMPLPIMMAHKILKELKQARVEGSLPYLRPDAKSQVTIEYDKEHRPVRVHTVVLSTQHQDGISQEQITQDMKKLVGRIAPPGFIDRDTLFYINPTGRFVIGGPQGDCGLTGRKIIVDTYGGAAHHGGGAFSGKDPTKVDRSGAYAGRYIAKNIVSAGFARKCEIQVSYAIGIAHPISIKVDTYSTGTVPEELLCRAIPLVFSLTPKSIIDMLELRRPIYRQTAYGGHFGRTEAEFSWERTDKVDALIQAVKQEAHTIA